MKISWLAGALAAALIGASAGAGAQNVKVTPLGTHAGELCDRDRATIFEDATGVRILYDPGQSVLGADDPRLGRIDVVLVSHAHGDHIGDQKLRAASAGTCDRPELVSAAPSSTTADIVAARNSALVVVTQMSQFLATKIAAIKGRPMTACPQTGPDIVVPAAAPCIGAFMTGGTRNVRTADAKQAVQIVAVPAQHDSTVPRTLLHADARKALDPDDVSVQLGPPIGYVIRFTNGLVAYLSGDTGMHAEMKSVVHDYYHANLMELNLGPNAVTPNEAAYVANELVQPAAVIVSHVNEAATADGKVRPGSRTATFISLVRGRPVYLALSGRTLEFSGEGRCVAGC
jgi:L-ascorbate metabolism protein UlaG (beta-lactamase superfamily)